MTKENITTIKLEKQTKLRLDKFKEHEKESYNQVLTKILHILNLVRKDPLLAERVLETIDKHIRRKVILNKQILKENN